MDNILQTVRDNSQGLDLLLGGAAGYYLAGGMAVPPQTSLIGAGVGAGGVWALNRFMGVDVVRQVVNMIDYRNTPKYPYNNLSTQDPCLTCNQELNLQTATQGSVQDQNDMMSY